jgi:hypothetical protein
VLFLRGRLLYLAVASMLVFHAVSYATIEISFLPHVLCVLAFLPLERLGKLLPSRSERPSPVTGC